MESTIKSAQQSISCTVLGLIWMFCFNKTLIYTKGFKRWTIWSEVGALWSWISYPEWWCPVLLLSQDMPNPFPHFCILLTCAVIAYLVPLFWRQFSQFDQTERCQVFVRVFFLQKFVKSLPWRAEVSSSNKRTERVSFHKIPTQIHLKTIWKWFIRRGKARNHTVGEIHLENFVFVCEYF